jgi:hypothetical protein
MNDTKLDVVRTRLLVLLILVGVCLCISKPAEAFPALFPDARSAAMGSTGVASDPRNAVFFNPALLATEYEQYSWYAFLPSYHETIADPDNLDSGLNHFLAAANDLFSNSTEANRQATATALAALENKEYRERNAKTVLLGVPGIALSGAFYISRYQVFTATPVIDNSDYADINNITNNSTIDYRGLDITEMGFSSALPFRNAWLGDFKLGATLKLQLMDGLAYSKEVVLSDLSLNNEGEVDKTSTFNFDVGFSKEVGVWNFGLAASNIIKKGVNLGNSSETYSLEPLLRAGVAYRSRKTYFEVDADLLTSQQFGVEEKSQFVSAGWEYSLLPWLFVRAGAQYDLGGNNLSTFSYGLGLNLFGFQLDGAATTNAEEQGLYAQLTLKF